MSEVRRILFVDDDPGTRYALASLLQSEGYDVDTCSSAESALELLSAQHYDCLVTDHIMAGMTGLELTQVARESDPGLRCCVITGHVPPPEHERRNVYWIAKPLELEVLLAALIA